MRTAKSADRARAARAVGVHHYASAARLGSEFRRRCADATTAAADVISRNRLVRVDGTSRTSWVRPVKACAADASSFAGRASAESGAVGSAWNASLALALQRAVCADRTRAACRVGAGKSCYAHTGCLTSQLRRRRVCTTASARKTVSWDRLESVCRTGGARWVGSVKACVTDTAGCAKDTFIHRGGIRPTRYTGCRILILPNRAYWAGAVDGIIISATQAGKILSLLRDSCAVPG